jgi:hypothetical protein
MKKAIVFLLALTVMAGVLQAQNMTIQLTSPYHRQQFAPCSDILLQANVSITTGEIRNVQFYRGSTNISNDSRAPYEYNWRNVPYGYYMIWAKVNDKLGNSVSTDPVFIYVGDVEKGNMIMNGEFTCGGTPWAMNNQAGQGAVATVAFDSSQIIAQGEAAVVTVTNGGTADWHVQMHQPFPIDSGTTYEISFAAMVTEPRTITIEFQENSGSYAIHNSASVSLESSDIYGPFIWEAPVTDPTNYFRFCLGGSPGTIWIDQVIIYDNRYTAVKDRRAPGAPASSRIVSQNFPNPFNGGTVIQYQLPESADVRVSVFDLQGRPVAELLAEKQNSGDHWIRWNGLSGTGESLASGVYVYRIEAGTREKTSVFSKKIIMIE